MSHERERPSTTHAVVKLGPAEPMLRAIADFYGAQSVTLWNHRLARAAGVLRLREMSRLRKAGVAVVPTWEFHSAEGWIGEDAVPADGIVVVQRLAGGEPVGSGVRLPGADAKTEAALMSLATGAVSVQDGDGWGTELCVPMVRAAGCAVPAPAVVNSIENRRWTVAGETQEDARRLAQRVARLVDPLPVARVHMRTRYGHLEVADLSTVVEVFPTGPTMASLESLGLDRSRAIQLCVLGAVEHTPPPQ